MTEQTYCGFVAIIGRPNVGKSTLLNTILGEKISITAAKAQTTRHTIRGIKTTSPYQTIYLDTPGLQQHYSNTLNRAMSDAALQALQDIDVIIFVLEALRWLPEDDWILQQITASKAPILLAINKVDRVQPKELLLPYIEMVYKKTGCQHVVPISAEKNMNIDALEHCIEQLLPAAPYYFPEQQRTDRDEKFLLAEMVREQLIRYLGQELPHQLAVEISAVKQQEKCTHVDALIWVGKASHKKMIIGEHGEKLKQIGSIARAQMEKMLEQQVYLRLWVKVKKNWFDDSSQIQRFGI